jgi:hypothetical protein
MIVYSLQIKLKRMSPKVKQFIELQEQVNIQIDITGQAEAKLADELEQLGDQLTNAEINEVCEYYQNQIGEDDVDEWMDEIEYQLAG